MEPFLNQAYHNQKLLEYLDQQFPDNYFDWKITVAFYVAIHLLKALGKKRNVHLGNTHEDIQRSLAPRQGNPVIHFRKHAWDNYKSLYRYSREARYEGMLDPDITNEVMRDNFKQCKQHLSIVLQYLKTLGIAIPDQQ